MAEEAGTRRKRPSIYDVADRARVSHMTVSRVLNGSTSIRESTRERVQQAIEEIGYRPSNAAREFATQRSMRIGAIVHSPAHHGPKSTLLAIEQAARGRGYGVASFSLTSADDDDLELAVATLQAQGIEGVCVVGPNRSINSLHEMLDATTPTVVVGDRGSSATASGVGIDQADGTNRAMCHLLDNGHRVIMHLSGALNTDEGKAREQQWRAALGSRGLSADHLVVGDWSSDFGYHVGLNYEAIDEVTAVFAANDQMALGMIHGLWVRGIRVPGEISVVGFDDIPEAAHFIPPLTTVRQDIEALGTAVVDEILALIGRQHRPTQSFIGPELIVRSSTARL